MKENFFSVHVFRGVFTALWLCCHRAHFANLRGLRTIQWDPCTRPLFVLITYTVSGHGSQSVAAGMFSMGTDGSQLLQDICLPWVTPSVPDAKQNGWWTTLHIHPHLFWKARCQVVCLTAAFDTFSFLINITDNPLLFFLSCRPKSPFRVIFKFKVYGRMSLCSPSISPHHIVYSRSQTSMKCFFELEWTNRFRFLQTAMNSTVLSMRSRLLHFQSSVDWFCERFSCQHLC